MSSSASPPVARKGVRLTFERVALGVATVLIGINLWTGFPLLALWVGSQAAGSSGLSSGAVFVVLAVLAVTEALGVIALTRLSARYDRITGHDRGPRQPAVWLRSMRSERQEVVRKQRELNAIERIVIAIVVGAVIAFEIWFFFFAGSSLPHGS